MTNAIATTWPAMIRIARMLTSGLVFAGVVYGSICLLLYLSQRAHIYFPTGRSDAVPAFTLRFDDAQLVISIRDAQTDQAVIYFGGNAEDVSRALAPLAQAFPGAALYAMHYRGYGGSSGTPSEPSLVADGKALLDHVRRRHPKVTIIGRSLGSGIATQIAASHPIERLILVTPFDSLAELAAEHFSWLPVRMLLKDKYPSAHYARQLRVPTTIVMASNDEIVSNASTQRLARAFPPNVARVVTLRGADHNFPPDSPDYLAALKH